MAAWWWQRQLGGGGSAAAEAAVADGQDEGREVVTWNLFMICDFFTLISSVPVDRSEGSNISVFV